ncbi:glutathione S-transferase family protein [Pseudoduganella sp. FT93W]|uniref:Glutathione S-transferase family protein n=1 Tax=Duganella fentianensis TaxID=2692177 RepID=A0A845I083_9BURK|nr:glutathione S-transferase family protein [Duganella fentianensis]MYN45487.1 glutathione S-transferase family protein [Duganella fentianensis]
MKLYSAPRAPNPRRVAMFLAEKGITDVELLSFDLLQGQQRSAGYLQKNPFGRVPALELDDGRILTETRAICSWLEGYVPEPNLMGEGYDERAFIEMADRRVELYLLQGIADCARHTHPALAPLEQPQFPEFGAAQGERMRVTARWLDQQLAQQPYIAGQRYTIADITAFCALEFGRGLLKFRPGDEAMPHLQAWRDRIAARPGAQAAY